MAHDDGSGPQLQLHRAVDPDRDHVRGAMTGDAVVVVGYQDFLCPYCRRLRLVFRRLRAALGDRLVYVYRYFPNERANPGAELAAQAAEAAARQGRFDEMHDALFDHQLPIGRPELLEMARAIGLDLARFERDLASELTQARVEQDHADGRKNGVTGTPTLFVDGVRYDGAWDYHSLLEALERPVAARVQRRARVFASLPTSAGLVLLLMALLAIACANTPLAPLYDRVMSTHLGLELGGKALSLTLREFLAEGLLSVFFLVVGLEIRRELTTGELTDWRAALLPVVAAVGGVVAPALVYLAINRGTAAAHGWSIPTATDIAFSLGLLAILGDRVPIGLRVFVASLAVVDDIFSVLVLAIFYPRSFSPSYALAVAACMLALVAFNRARVYAIWPYVALGLALWLSLHALGIHPALAGVLLAACLPTRPTPKAAPLLAQAATALAALEHAESEANDVAKVEREPLWEWAALNLSAASARFLSTAERIERVVAPWSAYVILPAFALSATGVRIAPEFATPDSTRIFAGVALGLVVGKPLGVLTASGLALATRVAVAPDGVTKRDFIGAATLCGVGDTLALLMADRSFASADAAIAKLAVLTGTAIAAVVGTLVLRSRPAPRTPARS